MLSTFYECSKQCNAKTEKISFCWSIIITSLVSTIEFNSINCQQSHHTYSKQRLNTKWHKKNSIFCWKFLFYFSRYLEWCCMKHMHVNIVKILFDFSSFNKTPFALGRNLHANEWKYNKNQIIALILLEIYLHHHQVCSVFYSLCIILRKVMLYIII